MLSVLHDGGIVATVMPHGVLFRGGEEQRIRTGMLDDDVIDAVLGLRARGSKPAERRGKILFINATTRPAARRTIWRQSTPNGSSTSTTGTQRFLASIGPCPPRLRGTQGAPCRGWAPCLARRCRAGVDLQPRRTTPLQSQSCAVAPNRGRSTTWRLRDGRDHQVGGGVAGGAHPSAVQDPARGRDRGAGQRQGRLR